MSFSTLTMLRLTPGNSMNLKPGLKLASGRSVEWYVVYLERCDQ